MEKYIVCALIGITYITAIAYAIATIDTVNDIERPPTISELQLEHLGGNHLVVDIVYGRGYN